METTGSIYRKSVPLYLSTEVKDLAYNREPRRVRVPPVLHAGFLTVSRMLAQMQMPFLIYFIQKRRNWFFKILRHLSQSDDKKEWREEGGGRQERNQRCNNDIEKLA